MLSSSCKRAAKSDSRGMVRSPSSKLAPANTDEAPDVFGDKVEASKSDCRLDSNGTVESSSSDELLVANVEAGSDAIWTKAAMSVSNSTV